MNITKYPQSFSQNSTTVTKWTDLKNTGNSSSSKATHTTGTGITPAPITLKNFQFGLPENSRVKKITVEYRHIKTTGSLSTATLKVGSPTIEIAHGNNVMGRNKGQAPTESIKAHSLSFTGDWTANILNDSNFQVHVKYPKVSKGSGTIKIQYVRVMLEYIVPNYSISLDKVVGGYNKEEYMLEATISNLNDTDGNPSVVITHPNGFSFIESRGQGSIVHVDTNTLVWTPNLAHGVGSNGCILSYMPNVVYTGGSQSYTGTFVASVSGYGNTTHTATITEKPIEHDTEEQTDPVITDKDLIPYLSDCKIIEINEVIEFSVETEPEETLIPFAFPIKDDGTIIPYTGDSSLEFKYGSAWALWVPITVYLDTFGENDYISTAWEGITDYSIRSVDEGLFVIKFYEKNSFVSWEHYKDLTPVKEVKLLVRPSESDLSTPYMTVMTPNSEELNRLGDGYSYTVQSDLKEVTEETYVRDWYKNFRICVFNNRIEANCTDYINYDTDTTSQDRELTFYTEDLTGCYFILTVDNSLNVTYNEIVTQLNSNNSMTINNLEEYVLPLTFAKQSNDNVILTATLYNSNNAILQTYHYKVNFNAETYKEPYPSTTDTTDYDNLTLEQIISNAKYIGTAPSTVNTYQSRTCPFTYDEDYPLYVLLVGDYPEAETPAILKFTEPCIIETASYNGREPNGKFPVPIQSVIDNDDGADLTLETYETSNNIVCYKLPLLDGYGTNTEMAIRGIELTGNIEQSDNLSLTARLKSPTGATGTRTIIINEYNTNENADKSFSIGGNGDLWGFRTLDMVEMDDWELEIGYSNLLSESQANISFNDLQLIFYIEPVTEQGVLVKIEDEDTRYYGAFLRNLIIPFGLKTDTNYLDIDGTDTNDAYRQNIREKEITLEFDVGDGCDLEANTQTIRQLTKLILNEKDSLNRPIPKRIWFSHLPDLYAEYICEDVFDTEIEIGSYIIKAKLTIPAGCFYTIETRKTNNIGYVQGVASIYPTISIKPTSKDITITEKHTNQKYTINLPNIEDYQNGIIEIDCENQICWYKANTDDLNPTNINKYVDFNADWFTLKNEYQFTCAGAVLRIVDYPERW